MTHTVFSTFDLVLAASLKSKGYVLEKIEMLGKRGTFFFLRVPAEEVDNITLFKGTVEPYAFQVATRHLTTLAKMSQAE